MRQALAAGEAYGQKAERPDDYIQVEYVSANPTGLLHVGHGRGAAYGSALVNLLRADGYKVDAEYYINDAGKQIDNMALSVNARYMELLGKPSEFPENGYHGQDIIDTAQALIDWKGDFFLSLPETERIPFFKEYALCEKLDGLRKTLNRFNVHFDTWFSERSLHKGKIQAAIKQLQADGKIYEKDGALWLKSTECGDDKDRVVVRDNGEGTYLAADIAYHRDKCDRGFKEIIDIWGADHHGYVARVKAALQLLGYDPDKMTVLLLQW